MLQICLKQAWIRGWFGLNIFKNLLYQTLELVLCQIWINLISTLWDQFEFPALPQLGLNQVWIRGKFVKNSFLKTLHGESWRWFWTKNESNWSINFEANLDLINCLSFASTLTIILASHLRRFWLYNFASNWPHQYEKTNLKKGSIHAFGL